MNSGVYVCDAKTFLNQFEVHQKSMFDAVSASIALCEVEGHLIKPNKVEWVKIVGDSSIDYSLTEKLSAIECVPLNANWSDVGNWQEFFSLVTPDENGNRTLSNATLLDSFEIGVVSKADKMHVAVLGLKGIYVIATDDSVLVMDKNRTQDKRVSGCNIRGMGWNNHPPLISLQTLEKLQRADNTAISSS